MSWPNLKTLPQIPEEKTRKTARFSDTRFLRRSYVFISYRSLLRGFWYGKKSRSCLGAAASIGGMRHNYYMARGKATPLFSRQHEAPKAFVLGTMKKPASAKHERFDNRDIAAPFRGIDFARPRMEMRSGGGRHEDAKLVEALPEARPTLPEPIRRTAVPDKATMEEAVAGSVLFPGKGGLPAAQIPYTVVEVKNKAPPARGRASRTTLVHGSLIRDDLASGKGQEKKAGGKHAEKGPAASAGKPRSEDTRKTEPRGKAPDAEKPARAKKPGKSDASKSAKKAKRKSKVAADIARRGEDKTAPQMKTSSPKPVDGSAPTFSFAQKKVVQLKVTRADAQPNE
ncbi:MAG: hypothetical protein V1827_05095 [Candidatus Micrarchaeota archaeon]